MRAARMPLAASWEIMARRAIEVSEAPIISISLRKLSVPWGGVMRCCRSRWWRARSSTGVSSSKVKGLHR